jgi:hypothetical protein
MPHYWWMDQKNVVLIHNGTQPWRRMKSYQLQLNECVTLFITFSSDLPFIWYSNTV